MERRDYKSILLLRLSVSLCKDVLAGNGIAGLLRIFRDRGTITETIWNKN